MQTAGAIGLHGFWGYSSSYDIHDVLIDEGTKNFEPINVLLVQPGDIRHILTTVSRRRRHCNKCESLRPIHFYLLEWPHEVLARDMLLLEVLNDFEVPIRQRANAYLEIFGNAKLQDRTSRYVEQIGHQLRDLIGHGRGRLENIVDLNLLKFREKDMIEDCFKSYNRMSEFDMEKLRDHRMRGHYADRYDHRSAVGDWDYHQFVKPIASIIHIKLYKEWRTTGIAFEFGDQTYTEPNRTLMSYTEGVMKAGKCKGEKKEVKGYWGDIVCSPYISIGIDCDTPNAFAEGLFEILNKNTGVEQHRHHTVEVAVYNLLSSLWEIETGLVYQMTKANEIFSGLGQESRSKVLATDISITSGLPTIAESDENITETPPPPPTSVTAAAVATEDSDTLMLEDLTEPVTTSAPSAALSPAEEQLALEQDIRRAECIVQCWHDVKVFPMLGPLSTFLDKKKFENQFDAVFVSSRATQSMQHVNFGSMVKPQGSLAVETAKHVVVLNAEQKDLFLAKASELALAQGFAPAPTTGARVSPVRRHRDAEDTTDDVIFFTKT